MKSRTTTAIILWALSGCAVYQSIQEPVLRVLRRGSCVAVDIPPITLTPERTAAERQLMGKETEIEPDGWLIASAQSSAHGTSSSREPTAHRAVRRYYIEQGTLEFYHDAIIYYKSIGLLGESFDGSLLLVPLSKLSAATKETYLSERDTAKIVAQEVSRSRAWLREYRSKHPDEFPKEEQSYYAKSRAGEWVLTPQKRWVQVK